MTKIFGPLVALDDVSIKVEAGSFHALLGENGAGKSTLVKSIMGFYTADTGQVLLDGHGDRDPHARAMRVRPRHRHGLPALYAGALPDGGGEPRDLPRRRAGGHRLEGKEKRELDAFLDPHAVPGAARTCRCRRSRRARSRSSKSSKQLYLDQRFLILDEPTSVLTPGEADEVLGPARRHDARAATSPS